MVAKLALNIDPEDKSAPLTITEIASLILSRRICDSEVYEIVERVTGLETSPAIDAREYELNKRMARVSVELKYPKEVAFINAIIKDENFRHLVVDKANQYVTWDPLSPGDAQYEKPADLRVRNAFITAWGKNLEGKSISDASQQPDFATLTIMEVAAILLHPSPSTIKIETILDHAFHDPLHKTTVEQKRIDVIARLKDQYPDLVKQIIYAGTHDLSMKEVHSVKEWQPGDPERAPTPHQIELTRKHIRILTHHEQSQIGEHGGLNGTIQLDLHKAPGINSAPTKIQTIGAQPLGSEPVSTAIGIFAG